jgi:hypothetical protein
MSVAAYVRRNPEAAAMTAILDEAGVPWDVTFGRRHAKLVYFANGRRHAHPISATPSDHRSAKNAASYVRKNLRQLAAQQSAALT